MKCRDYDYFIKAVLCGKYLTTLSICCTSYLRNDNHRFVVYWVITAMAVFLTDGDVFTTENYDRSDTRECPVSSYHHCVKLTD